MAVYVDRPRYSWRLGRMHMCHMVADSDDELRDMADAIGVQRRHIQDVGTSREHLDVCKAKRREAIRRGALSVDSKAIVRIMRKKARRKRARSE